MLVLREYRQTHGNLWIYDVFHGSYRMGRLEPVHTSDLRKKLEGWAWRLTPFDVDKPAVAWQHFIDMSAMASGVLRLRPQPDHAPGLSDNLVFAGEFLLGRIYQQHSRFSVDWHWLIIGLHGYTPSGAVDREDAMAQIKAAWRSVYEQTQSGSWP